MLHLGRSSERWASLEEQAWSLHLGTVSRLAPPSLDPERLFLPEPPMGLAPERDPDLAS